MAETQAEGARLALQPYGRAISGNNLEMIVFSVLAINPTEMTIASYTARDFFFRMVFSVSWSPD